MLVPRRGFAGTWTGPVTQPRSAIPRWTAMLVLARGGRSGTFVVSGFCRGSMTLLAVSRTRLVAREVISSDPQNRCAASGTVGVPPVGVEPTLCGF